MAVVEVGMSAIATMSVIAMMSITTKVQKVWKVVCGNLK
jgi:hypothetical protein